MIELQITRAINEKPEIGLAGVAGNRRQGVRGRRCARRHRRRGVGHQRRRRHPLLAEFVPQAFGELVHDLRRGGLDDAGAAAVLRDRSGQRQVGVDQHLAALAGGLQPEFRGGVGAAAAFGVAALGGDFRAVVLIVDLVELHRAGEGQRHRAEPHRDAALVGGLVHHLGQFGARHAGCDPLDVEQDFPCLVERQRYLERIIEFHAASVLPLITDPVGPAELLPDPAGAGKQPRGLHAVAPPAGYRPACLAGRGVSATVTACVCMCVCAPVTRVVTGFKAFTEMTLNSCPRVPPTCPRCGRTPRRWSGPSRPDS